MDERILDGWLTAIATESWALARIDTAAAAAGMTTAEVAARLPDRWSALAAYGRRLDVAALAEAGSDRDASVRDRLFALIMARFDAGEDHKAATRQLSIAARRDPGLALCLGVALYGSTGRIAEAAGVVTGGLLGPLRVKALTALVLHVSRVWLDDTDPDLAATMKALDTALERAERWAGSTAPSPPGA